MKVFSFCPRWGHAHLSWNEFATRVKQYGYDGVETDIPTDKREREIVLNAIAKEGLQLIAQHWETVEPDFDTHLTEYRARLQTMALADPLFINSQTGKDYYSFEQNEQLIRAATELTETTGILVYHETHRGKFSFAAHITNSYLQRIPDLLLTLDISHWTTVAETFLQDQEEAVSHAISRTRHFHARVGHTQAAQVSDPRSPEWQEAVAMHLSCWDKIYAVNKDAGKDMLTFTAEFGPAPYMPAIPFTRQPIADQWDVNVYMSEMLKSRYREV